MSLLAAIVPARASPRRRRPGRSTPRSRPRWPARSRRASPRRRCGAASATRPRCASRPTAASSSPARAGSSTSSTASTTRRRRSSPTCARACTTTGTAGCWAWRSTPASPPGGRTSTSSTPTTRRRTRASSRAGATAARRRPAPTDDGCVITGRLSRLNAAGAETVLIEDFCQQYPSHSVGTIDFGPDGMLYVSAGDGASFNWADYGQDGSPVNPCGDPPGATLTPPTSQGGALRSQSFRRPGAQDVTLDGAILRVHPDTGAAAPGNPAIGDADPQPPADRRLRLPQPVPLHLPPRHGRDLVRRRRLEHRRGDQPHAGRRRRSATTAGRATRARAPDGLLRHAEPRPAARRSTARARVTAPYFAYKHADKVVPGRELHDRLVVDLRAGLLHRRRLPARLQGRAVLQRLLAQLHLGHVPRAPTGCRTRRRARPSWPAPPARCSSPRARTARSTTPTSPAARSAGSRPTTARRPRASPPTRPRATRR